MTFPRGGLLDVVLRLLTHVDRLGLGGIHQGRNVPFHIMAGEKGSHLTDCLARLFLSGIYELGFEAGTRRFTCRFCCRGRWFISSRSLFGKSPHEPLGEGVPVSLGLVEVIINIVE